MSLRIAFVEWPEGLTVDDERWPSLADAVTAARPDILLTNELPFGPWMADGPTFSEVDAEHSIRAHKRGQDALSELDIPAVISTHPVWKGKRLANEAFVLEKGIVRPLHRKQYFPNEPGWFESEWYTGDASGFEVADVAGVKVGVLVCTEAMFNERARGYGRDKAEVLVIPRASGTNIESWKIAGAMASLVAGAYVVSSNRVGMSSSGTQFGGGGFAYAPQGRLLAVTTADDPLRIFEVKLEEVVSAQKDYPCYVPEII